MTPKHPVRIIVFKLYILIGAKITKPTQMSGFIFGGPLGPKFELFLFTIIGVVIYFFCYNFGTLLINKY